MRILSGKHYYLEIVDRQDGFTYVLNETGRRFFLKFPTLEINGYELEAVLEDIDMSDSRTVLKNGVLEVKVFGKIVGLAGARLCIIFRAAEDNPVLRFRYEIFSEETIQLTKVKQRDNLTYLKIQADISSRTKEIQLSDFNETLHSYLPAENVLDNRHFENETGVMGPILLELHMEYTAVSAYEHGSQVPDRFLEFQLGKDYSISVRAVKGNYYNGQEITEERPFESIWLQFGVCTGGEEKMAAYYREFALRYLSLNVESRKPYIFYNTWAYQERNKWWNHQKYVDSMNEARILHEVEIAYEMGIEVFVLDMGWFEKSGDWEVDTSRFPKRLQDIRALLARRGMKLGLWFNPQAAAVSSRILRENRDCTIRNEKGRENDPKPVWETEASYQMCLVSRYWEAFADLLIRLVHELGVIYFKWDGLQQYGCCAAGHYHGKEETAPRERAECYAFEIGRYMSKVADRLCEHCPEAIVDFDVTEDQRYVGLGFLSSGKYYLVNNGPYYRTSDIPKKKEEWSNIYVFPGTARTRICRMPLVYDKWIPSVLFMTHYLPDDLEESQFVNVASLILGQNGIWGDLPGISSESVIRIAQLLRMYKMVRDDITRSPSVRCGNIGGCAEIHEKLNPQNGKGVVVIFTSGRGKHTYVTVNYASKNYWCRDRVKVRYGLKGCAVIECRFDMPGAEIIFFGV